MKISAQFATSLHSPAHIAIAEELGYDRAWLFDTPHESPDVWMMLALAATRTTTIGLGPGVLVPTLLGLAAVKFALVVMWFMHLKFDSPTYARFFLMGLAGAATLYLVVLISFGIFLVD